MVAVTEGVAVQQGERRRAARLRPAFNTVCVLHRRPHKRGVGLVWDLSLSGVSMLVAYPPAEGEVIRGVLDAETGGSAVEVTLRVVRVRPTTTGDYFLAAEFDRPLRDDQLQTFVSHRPVPSVR